MLLRVALSCIFVVVLLNGIRSDWYLFGLSHVFLGTFFLIVKPYKRKWMNESDGLTLISFGTYTSMYKSSNDFHNRNCDWANGDHISLSAYHLQVSEETAVLTQLVGCN